MEGRPWEVKGAGGESGDRGKGGHRASRKKGKRLIGFGKKGYPGTAKNAEVTRTRRGREPAEGAVGSLYHSPCDDHRKSSVIIEIIAKDNLNIAI